MPTFQAINCYKTLATHVAVGMGAASFWRGAWYVLDDTLLPGQDAASAAASLVLGILGMRASQGLVARAERMGTVATSTPTTISSSTSSKSPSLFRVRHALVRNFPWATAFRFGALYTLSMSVVLIWRGTWKGWDCLYEYYWQKYPPLPPASPLDAPNVSPTLPMIKSTDPGHATYSGVISHVTAVTLLLATGLFASVLAPPAAVSVIRDWTVRASAYQYTAPGQNLVQQLFSMGTGTHRSQLTPAVAQAQASIVTDSRRRALSTWASERRRKGNTSCGGKAKLDTKGNRRR